MALQRVCSLHKGAQLMLPLLTTSSYVPHASMFWEPDRKGGYGEKTKINKPTTTLIKEGLLQMPEELSKYKDEQISKFRCDSAWPPQHGDYEVIWKFDSKPAVSDWLVTKDKDLGEGKSDGEFILGPNKTGMFQGTINTEIPKDGIIKRAGYVNIRAPRYMKSFQRETPRDWSEFTHLVMRVRGDGRTYMMMLGMDRYFDISWADQYHFPLYTRGGPYWQVAKIPFSKFYLAGKGRVQDKQEAVQLDKIAYLGITAGDSYDGPFNLEIDYVGVILDMTHKDKFDYEMYQCSFTVFS